MSAAQYSFIHAADLHIDSPLRGLERYEEAPVEEMKMASRRAFENLVARAVADEVAFVILAGDVFDGDWTEYSTGLWFTARLRTLTSAGIRVYLLAGNHDAEGKMTAALQYPEGVFTFSTAEPETFVDEPTGAVLHGQGFAQAATYDNLAAAYPSATPGAVNIGVLHTALGGSGEHEPYAPCSRDDLRAKGYDYWGLGHVHARQVVSEDPWIVFPGNLQARHIRETGPKGATFVTVTDGRIERVEAEAFDVARYTTCEIDVTACASRAECDAAVSEALVAAQRAAEGRILAIRLRLTGRSPANASLRRDPAGFLAACRDQANALQDVWIEKVRVETREVADGGSGIAETLELEAEDLQAEVLASVRSDFDTLQAKLGVAMPSGIALDEEALKALLTEAQAEIILRLVDADATQRETGAR